MLLAAFCISLLLILYTYVLFPLLLLLRAAVWRRPCKQADITPSVTLIIACHNEQGCIEAKLRNVLSLDYPEQKLEVIIASDGSDDRTEELVDRFCGDRVTLLRLPRLGKAAALNAAASRAAGEILAFSDANSIFSPDALRELVRPFADPRVGGVAGDQRYVRQQTTATTQDGEQSYWSYDRLLKSAQSRAGSVTSATGAIYAVRRSLFQPVPAGVTDDFVTSARVVMQGYRLVFAPGAIAYEGLASSSGAEFRRKVRLMTRGLQGVMEVRSLLSPARHGFYALQLFSHKLLRRLIALGLLVLLVSSVLLWGQGWIFQLVTIGQLIFYGCAALGGLLAGTRLGRSKVLTIPAYFVLANMAALIATLNTLRGRRIEIWQPSSSDTQRPAHRVA